MTDIANSSNRSGVPARREGETRFEYHKRLLTAKLIDKTLDADYAELSPFLYGKEYAPDVARRMAYGSMKTIELAEQDGVRETDTSFLEETEQKLTELRIERQKLNDYRAAVNKAIRERARHEEMSEMIRDAINSGNLPELTYKPVEIKESDNDLIVTLNDIHFGANVNNAWRTYNSDVCRDMMCGYLDEIEEIRKTHGSTGCVVVCGGDSISGNIHYGIAVSNRENVIEQVMGVSELIALFLSALSERFKWVRFVEVSGNHSRLTPNKDEALDGERLDDLVGWYLEARLAAIGNIKIDLECRIDPTLSVFTLRGKKYALVHGDYDGGAVKTQTISDMAGGGLYAVISGHLHHNATDKVSGVRTIMAGSFLGMDDYCVKKRILSEPEQTVCVCTDAGIRCAYPVSLKT